MFRTLCIAPGPTVLIADRRCQEELADTDGSQKGKLIVQKNLAHGAGVRH